MQSIATITYKKQLAIPAQIFRRAGLKEGQKVLVSHEDGRLLVEPVVDVVNALAGSIDVPARFKGKGIDAIVRQAKEERAARRAQR